jgi:hypothetical protein
MLYVTESSHFIALVIAGPLLTAEILEEFGEYLEDVENYEDCFAIDQ